MIKFLLLGFWGCIVAVGSSYVATSWKLQQANTANTATEASGGVESHKTRVLNVPIISEGMLQGYVSAQFTFVADEKVLKAAAVPAEVYLLDEAFRILYSDESINFHQIEKYDLNKFTTKLVQRMKERLATDTIKEVLIEQFSFIPVSQIHN